MKALVLENPYKVQMKELPVPEIRENQVLVKNEYCAVCNATDTKMYTGKHAQVTFPSVFGHEGTGRVVKVGKHVKGIAVGDAVLGAGYPVSPGMGSFWGHYSEYGVCSGEEVIRIPEGVSLKDATVCHMLAEALNAFEISGVRPGDTVAIIGCGAVGLSILSILKHSFAKHIIAIDIDREKLDKAQRLGADITVCSKEENVKESIEIVTGRQDVDVVFEAVGSSVTYELAYEILKYKGIIVPFGMIEGIMEVPFRKLYAKELQIRWIRSTGAHGKEYREIVLNMMKKGMIQANQLITNEFQMEDFETAIKSIMEGRQIRVIIRIL